MCASQPTPIVISTPTGIFDIVALISRVIAYDWEYGHARWSGILFTRCFNRCSMMRRRDSRGRDVVRIGSIILDCRIDHPSTS
ncbi:hypothetical protein EDB19DRAFT_2029239, partial [Suillus lakei]